MTLPSIRPMTDADVLPATDLIRRGDWGDRESFFRFALERPHIEPFVAEREGDIVGTAVASVHGAAGWVGTVFVDASQRGRGLGRALTEAARDALSTAGCSTQI